MRTWNIFLAFTPANTQVNVLSTRTWVYVGLCSVAFYPLKTSFTITCAIIVVDLFPVHFFLPVFRLLIGQYVLMLGVYPLTCDHQCAWGFFKKIPMCVAKKKVIKKYRQIINKHFMV